MLIFIVDCARKFGMTQTHKTPNFGHVESNSKQPLGNNYHNIYYSPPSEIGCR